VDGARRRSASVYALNTDDTLTASYRIELGTQQGNPLRRAVGFSFATF
jgi:hypothetical protein